MIDQNNCINCDHKKRPMVGGVICLKRSQLINACSIPWDAAPPRSPTDNVIFVLCECWYEGDSNLIDDTYVASSKSIERLKQYAYDNVEKDRIVEIYMPGESVPDDASYGWDIEKNRERYRIIKSELT